MIRFFLFPALAGVSFAACLPITGGRILGRDLALADSRFSALPATLTVGIPPVAGAKRIFAAAELQRLARANGISITDPVDLCFEIPTRLVGEEEAVAAMRRSLPGGAVLTISELAKFEVPAGDLEFPLAALEPPQAGGVQLWRGSVRYAESRKAPFWARVVVTDGYAAVIPTRDLRPDSPIGADALRIESRTGPLGREKLARSIEEVAGRAPRRLLKAGAAVPTGLLYDPPSVRRGDAVTVEVRSGPAHLHFDAVAEGAARDGEMIELRNPVTGRTFKARLDSGSRAVLVLGSGEKL